MPGAPCLELDLRVAVTAATTPCLELDLRVAVTAATSMAAVVLTVETAVAMVAVTTD